MTPRAWWTVFGVTVAGLIGVGLYEAHAASAKVRTGPIAAPSNAPTPSYAARPAATALAAALTSSGCSASNLSELCSTFQTQNNTDAGAVARVGTLPVSGQFDQATAAALAWYGSGVFTPCPGTTPLGPAVGGNQGNASSTAYLLSTYLQAHGCDGSTTLTTLVQNFQTANNTDTSGVGPTSGKPLTGTLPTTGTFDSATSQALALYSGTAAMTPCA